MKPPIQKLIEATDYDGLRQMLAEHPELANEGLPYDEVNTAKAHPLHRICDGVMSGTYTDEQAVPMAQLFLEYGADINGGELIEKNDTPLLAASSLHADKVAMLYIDWGAELNHPGCHGGTALHWAAWCGRPTVVEKLVQAHVEINRKCIDFQATPLFWAVHGSKENDKKDLPNYLECIRLLLRAGADKYIPNGNGKTIFDLLGNDDSELKDLLH